MKAVFLSLWVALIALGLAVVLRYSFYSEPVTKVPERWPLGTQIQTQQSRPKLLVFLHPYCPCSLATLHELESLLARMAKNKPDTRIIFFKPGQDSVSWQRGKLWQEAKKLTSATIVLDNDGSQSLLFHAHFSGQILLYSAEGNLLYNGGLTISRGHEGKNPGADYLYSLLIHKAFNLRTTPVFGCPLFSKGLPYGFFNFFTRCK